MIFVKGQYVFTKIKKFISIESSMLDSVYHMTKKLPKSYFEVKPSLYYANKSVNH